MRWKTFVDCPKNKCGGLLEWWEGEPIERVSDEGVKFSKPTHRFICTVCDYTGNWAQFTRQRLGRSAWKNQ